MTQHHENQPQPPSESPSVLVAVSDPSLPLLERALREEGLSYHLARTGGEALWYAQRYQPELILLDVALSSGQGFEVCQRLKSRDTTKHIPVMFLAAQNDVQVRSQGLQLGAIDFLAKPFQLRELVLRVQSHLAQSVERRQLLSEIQRLQQESQKTAVAAVSAVAEHEAPLLGDSPAAQLLLQAIQLYAPTSQSVLLTGPPGAGYLAIARAIHRQSPRAHNTFLYVNCAMLQDEQSSSFLTTTFTRDMLDGVGQRSQFFHAHQGTLFMDHVDELPQSLQKKLLDILLRIQKQRKKGQAVSPDVRIVCYALEDLRYAVQRGAFLPDLLPLLTQHRLVVPSLQERKQDIPVIADFFLQQSSRRWGKVVERISAESTHRLMSYTWPGNMDELQQLIEREVAITQSPVLVIDTHLLEEGISVDRYRLVRKLGEGGMGEVWHAKHRWLARSAAVKWVRPEPHLPPKEKHMMIQRFQREAQVISQLTSPYTVTLYDFGVEPSGTFYYVMELLNGMELQTMVERFGPLPAARLVPILQKVCRSLAEAHSHGLIHRDIKPDNIYICQLGIEYDFPKVLDFGIVKAQSEVETTPSHTERRGAIGTPGYMAPEAVTRRYPLDGRSDIYALGCVAFWALTGRPVFIESDPIALLRMHVYNEPSSPCLYSPHPIPPALENIVLSCIQKDPQFRPQSAEHLWELLRRVPLADSWKQEQAKAWWEANYVPGLSSSTESLPTLAVANMTDRIAFDSDEYLELDENSYTALPLDSPNDLPQPATIPASSREGWSQRVVAMSAKNK